MRCFSGVLVKEDVRSGSGRARPGISLTRANDLWVAGGCFSIDQRYAELLANEHALRCPPPRTAADRLLVASPPILVADVDLSGSEAVLVPEADHADERALLLLSLKEGQTISARYAAIILAKSARAHLVLLAPGARVAWRTVWGDLITAEWQPQANRVGLTVRDAPDRA